VPGCMQQKMELKHIEPLGSLLSTATQCCTMLHDVTHVLLWRRLPQMCGALSVGVALMGHPSGYDDVGCIDVQLWTKHHQAPHSESTSPFRSGFIYIYTHIYIYICYSNGIYLSINLCVCAEGSSRIIKDHCKAAQWLALESMLP
jgi:hypothetical protein